MPPSTDVLADKNARELVEARAKQLQAYVSAALRLVQRLGAPPVTYGTPSPYPPIPLTLTLFLIGSSAHCSFLRSDHVILSILL